MNAELLFDTYSRIKGRSAYSRLRRMITPAGVNFFGVGISSAIARSLGLTSYIMDSLLLRRIRHCRSEEPRDALDLLILAWERNDCIGWKQALGLYQELR